MHLNNGIKLKNSLLAWLLKYRWLVAACIFFIAWKFLLIFLLWHGRALPPEPDDALIYSGHIYSVARCPHIICNTPYVSLKRPDGYHYLSYRLFWGVVARLSQINVITLFQTSFYVGTVALMAALIYFIRQLTTNRGLQAFTLFVVSLYYGAGGYHGFFWVVPSFFSVMLFILLLGILLDSKWPLWSWPVWVVTPIFIFTHPISIYALGLLPAFAVLKVMFETKTDYLFLKKTAMAVGLGILIYLPVTAYLHHAWLPYTLDTKVLNNPTLSQSLAELSPILNQTGATSAEEAKEERVPGLTNIRNDYFNWLFPHWLGFGIFGLFCWLLWRYRQTTILALYFATLFCVVLAAMVHPAGGRALVVLWPITYVLYAFGFWYTFVWLAQLTHPRGRLAGIILTGLVLLVFIGANVAYSLLLANFINQKDTYSLPPQATAYLLSHTTATTPIISYDKVIVSSQINTELVTRPQVNRQGLTAYVVVFVPPGELPKRSILDEFFAIGTTLFRHNASPVYQNPIFSDALKSATPKVVLPKNYIEEAEFDGVTIYRNREYGS